MTKSQHASPVLKVDNNLEQFVWDNILLKNIAKDRLHSLKTIPTVLRNGKFQVFEVLVAESLCILDNTITWLVTSVQGDNGIDFKGEVGAKEIPNWFTLPAHTIFGQVKRRSNKIEENEIRSDLVKIFNYYSNESKSTLWAVIYVISSSTYSKKLKNISRILSEPTIKNIYGSNPPIIFLDGEKILSLCSMRSTEVLNMLKDSFSLDELNIFQHYLEKISYKTAQLFDFEVKGKNEGGTGSTIIKEVIISSNIGIPSNISLRINWVADPKEKNIVQLVRPHFLSHNDGIDITFSGQSKHILHIYLKCFAPGKISLGSINLLNEKGAVISTIALGPIEIFHQFTPSYYSRPNRKIISSLETIVNQTKAGSISVVAITGIGGSGKSRLCEELLDLAYRYNHNTLTVYHANNQTSKRRIIKDLFHQLSISDKDGPLLMEDIIAELKNIIKNCGDSWEHSLNEYFDNSGSIINIDVVVRCLFALLLLRTEKQPIAIHLNDMHWADKEDFLVFKQLYYNVKANQKYFNNGVLFVFEGRNKEALKIDEDYYSPLDWFDFLKSDFVVEKTVQNWETDESEEFLREIFKQSISKEEYVDPDDVPLHEELIKNVLYWANGNPMHLIEQIKLLLSMDVVTQLDNGLLYVRRKLPMAYAVPESTQGLIKQRIEFFRSKYSSYIEVLAFFAKIDKRVHSSLFDYVVRSLEDRKAIDIYQILKGMDFASMPNDLNPYFEFNHENYYQAFLQEDLNDGTLLPPEALKWYNKFENLTKRQVLDVIKINFLLTDIDYPKIASLAKAELSRNQNDDIDEHLYKSLCKIPLNYLSAVDYTLYSVQFELAEILIRTGSWIESLRLLENINAVQNEHFSTERYLDILLKAKAEIANIQIDLQKPNLAISEINDALKLVNQLEKNKKNDNFDAYRENLWDKKCVALWFNGQIDDAIKWQWKAYLTSKKVGGLRLSVVLQQLGTIFLHRNPRFGVTLLQRSLEMNQEIGDAHYQTTQIVKVQLLMGRLLMFCAIPNSYDFDNIRSLKQELENSYHDCMERKSIYVASICGLVCGATCAILMELTDAEYWFKMAIATSTMANLADVLWKARLNLAQLYHIQDSQKSRIEINLHAHEAQRILDEGLDLLPQEYKNKRALLTALPKAHINRLVSSFENDAKHIDWAARPYYLSRARQQQQVLHVRHNENDYFLMN